MKDIINQTYQLLIKNGKTIAVAESCTGGLVADLLTRLPGSSRYFILGIVAYSNKAKEDILKIPRSLIAKKGAVSKPIAQKMSGSIRKQSGVDFGIGITGIAGPAGGSPQKPVGTVFISISGPHKKVCKKFRFTGSRNNIRKQAALKALELLNGLM